MALACRSLSDPALDTLWHTLRSLAPLLCTLPEDLCVTVPFKYEAKYGEWLVIPSTGSQFVFLRAPIQQDFVRFFAYSRRVKKLGSRIFPQVALNGERLPGDEHGLYILSTYHRIPFAVWDFLSAFAPRPLFPDLQSIHHKEWEKRGDTEDHEIPIQPADMLFGPRLQKVEICCPDPEHYPSRATQLIRSLGTVAALSLRDLSIEAQPENRSYWRYDTTGSLYGPEIGLFHRMSSFSSCTVCVTPDALVALGHLPCLEYLTLYVNPAEYSWDSLSHGRGIDFFPALVQLTLYKISFEWCTPFLRVLSSTSLRGISIHSGIDPPLLPPLLEALCAAISELPSAHSLVDIFIKPDWYIKNRPGDTYRNTVSQIYWPEHITPLFALPAVQRLVIEGKCKFSLDDATLETISRSWPDLIELDLGWDMDDLPESDYKRSPEDDDFPYVTPWGLLHLARRCPRLTKLAIVVDWHWTPTCDYYALAPVPPVHLSGPAVSALRELDVRGSVLGFRRSAIASFLSIAFPHLERMWDPTEPAAWREVAFYYKWFLQVRTQERAYAHRSGRRLRAPAAHSGLHSELST
ncbi:hypothetical protein VTO73DRAFT_10639 [Trametes versicolor]